MIFDNAPNKRILPHSPLPRAYDFLTRHSARTFLVGYTLDKSLAPFDTTLVISHGLGYAPLHDMWYSELASVTGNYRTDYDPNIEPIWHTPIRVIGVVTTNQEYWLTTTPTSATVNISHARTTSGTYHIYFHVKLYMDGFASKSLQGTAWQVASPTGK